MAVARVLGISVSKDAGCRFEDNAIEVSHMPNAELRVVDSFWGHFAGGPGTSPDDIRVLDDALKELLAT